MINNIKILLFFPVLCFADNSLIIKEIAENFKIDGKLLIALCKVESGLNASAINHNDGGEASIGLCQVKLSTARWHGYKGLLNGLYNPKINAHYAAKHLAHLINKYKNEDKALAAYNMGSLKFNWRGEIWNRGYVKKVRKIYD